MKRDNFTLQLDLAKALILANFAHEREIERVA